MALDGLDLSVPEGGVFGFLGPNGSGKTTTIRCLLGLVRPSAGSCQVLGADTRYDLPSALPKIGSLVETPGLFPGMSGRENLALLGRLDGIGPVTVDKALERVGLAERADNPVKGYSLGMRQRLGIAIGLLKDPALLVLDEPVNGLDPAGIKDVRDLLRMLAAEGRTVFLSSHLLSEVQHTCDRVAIVAKGRTIVTGTVDEVMASQRTAGLVVRLADTAAGLEVLVGAGFRVHAADGALHVDIPASEAERVTKTLADRQLYLTELRPAEVDLETVFLELTAGTGAI